VVAGVLADKAREINPEWTVAVGRGWPFVTWKVAATLDGRVAAADSSSRWITGQAAREDVHELRRRVQAVIVGSGTALADDPSLTARDASGGLLAEQPIRVVVGRREIPRTAKLRDGAAPLRQYPGDDLPGVLADLAGLEVRHVLLEGGPRLAASFLRAGLVDRVRWYVAPAILGSGKAAVGDLGIATISGIRRLRLLGIRQVGCDVVIDAVPEASAQPADPWLHQPF
jgi:diaminohydroxyphosphoribosylaminopyrimidine deaminase/5-amino-6-(5-phosphoribosylamino)uracil reductase